MPTKFKDSEGNEKGISDEEVKEFCSRILHRFGGYTESNPVATPPFKGWWAKEKQVYVDFVVCIFAFVKLEQAEEAEAFFVEWKEKLEGQLHQEFVLICFHPLKIFGNL